jgi:hypothetical protein
VSRSIWDEEEEMKKFPVLVVALLALVASAACSSPDAKATANNVVNIMNPLAPTSVGGGETTTTPASGSIAFGSVTIYKGNPDCNQAGCETVTTLKTTQCGDGQVSVPANSNIHTRIELSHGKVAGREISIEKSVAGVDTPPSDKISEAGTASPFMVKLPGFASKASGNSWRGEATANETQGGVTLKTQQCVVVFRVQ